MKVQESAQMYLETILVLSCEKDEVRSIDIAEKLKYKKPSISVAMKHLRENGYIGMDEKGHITLTAKGKIIAESMYERHTVISNWLIDIGVDKTTAMNDACRIEHVISQESFDAIKKCIKNVKLTGNG